MTERRLKIINCDVDSDSLDSITQYKRKIQDILLKDADLLEVLHNIELEEKGASPEDYLNVNIFSYLKIPETQSVVKNFVCFEVDDLEPSTQNNLIIRKTIKIRVVAHGDDIETDYGIDRQDLLALIVKDDLNWTNDVGANVMKKIYDGGKVSENGYYYRDIHYLSTTTNDLRRGTGIALRK